MVEDDDWISRSERKREARALFELGRDLTELSPSQLQQIELPDSVREAVGRVQATPQQIARKRELQYLAKVLRAEPDTDSIAAALATALQPGRSEAAKLHRLEAWRDRLAGGDGAAVTDLVDARPDIDVQKLRQLQRQAVSEAQKGQAPRAARQLFRWLRDLDDAEPLPQPTGTSAPR